MEFLQLQYFYESAQSENFAKTAQRHIVPPSSVSASIKRLEEELGCRLFDRTGNTVRLNENGRKLQRSVGMIFDELHRVREELNSSVSHPVTIRILIRALRTSIVEAIAEYHKQCAGVCFETVFDLDEETFDSYDLIIDEQNDTYEGYGKFELCHFRIRFKAAKDHPLCGRPLTVRQLEHQSFVTMGKNSNLHRILLGACRKAGFEPKIVMQTNDAQCYGICIVEGMGIGLTREYMGDGASGNKTEFLQVTDFSERQVFYAYGKFDAVNPTVLDFCDFLKCRTWGRRRMP